MLLIRGFLWTLVGAMTLQGWLHADEYGSRAGMFGGVALSVAVWGERLGDGAWSWLLWQPRRVLLPRALVMAALEETARRPRIGVAAASEPLRTALRAAEAAEERMREAEARWIVRHGALLAGLATEGRAVWEAAVAAAAATEPCRFPMLDSVGCAARQELAAAAAAWRAILAMEGLPDGARSWLRAVGGRPAGAQAFYDRLQELHDLEWPTDSRVAALVATIPATAAAVINGNWERRTAASLLEGDLWAAAIRHVRAREWRLRGALAASGAGELWTAHERALNASLRLTGGGAATTVRDWFGEMAAYAWWLGDGVPTIVQRCAGQEGGDCVRIGPTEIAALSAQFSERARIVEDGVRRLFIGMWNALPAVGLVFIVELMVLACGGGGGAQWWRRRRWVEERPRPRPRRRAAVLRAPPAGLKNRVMDG